MWSSYLIVCLFLVYANSLYISWDIRHLLFLRITGGDVSSVTFSMEHPCIVTKESPRKCHSAFSIYWGNLWDDMLQSYQKMHVTVSHFNLIACFRPSMRSKDCHWDYIDFCFNSCLKYLVETQVPMSVCRMRVCNSRSMCCKVKLFTSYPELWEKEIRESNKMGTVCI